MGKRRRPRPINRHASTKAVGYWGPWRSALDLWLRPEAKSEGALGPGLLSAFWEVEYYLHREGPNLGKHCVPCLLLPSALDAQFGTPYPRSAGFDTDSGYSWLSPTKRRKTADSSSSGKASGLRRILSSSSPSLHKGRAHA